MNRSTFHTIGAVAATAVMLASCAKNEVISRRPSLDPDEIAFSVASGFVPADMPESKAGGQAEEKPAVLLGDSGDTLYLHPSVVPNDRGLTALPETRGVPIRNAGGINSFFVTAKINDGGGSEDDVLYIDDEEVKRVAEGGSIWTTAEGRHFWPDESTALDFYAYANFDDNGPDPNPVCENGKLGFSYIVSSGSGGSDAEQQSDILLALASASRLQTTDGDGTVDLNFEHALAGVQFRAKNIAGGTIKRITLRNLYAEGECTYSLSDSPVVEGGVTKNGTFEWTTTGNKVEFSQNMNVEVSESSTLPDGTLQDVTTGDNAEMTFMMIPQKLENAEVEIELVAALDGRQYTVSGRLSTTTGSWEAGNIYIYDISTDSINWTYVFEVTPSISMELGQTEANYTVTSYRYRTQYPDEKEAVPWRAQGIRATETDRSANGAVSDVSISEIIKSFTDSGNGDVSSSSYSLGIERNKMHTTWDGDLTLKNATPKGTADSPYDLSTSGGSLSQETANCYCINAPGTYSLPLVYGNAIKNGGRNTSAWNSQFRDYLDASIDSPYIYENHGYQPYDACLVWSDGFYMFEDIHLSEDRHSLIFSVNPEYMQQANAILAVRDAQGRIMWSWHIWVTERSLDVVHELQDGLGGSRTYGMMQCNLGWVDGKMVYYNDRELEFRFIQSTSGSAREMIVKQSGETFDYKDVGSTYYQWGRKDPIVALRNWDTYRFEDYRLHETSDPKYVYRTALGDVSVGTSIQNPNVFYLKNSDVDWLNGTISTLWDTSSGNNSNKETSVKTIYDPSPRGYKVPVPRAFSVFVNGNAGSLNGYLHIDEVHNKYRVYPKGGRQGTEIPLTATGQRADRSGLEAYTSSGGPISSPGGLWAMYGVYYWSCVQTPTNAAAAYSLCIRNDFGGSTEVYTYTFGGSKTMARPVRPIVD